jgi:hypothetical protein
MFKGKNTIISSYLNKEAKTNNDITLFDELSQIGNGRYRTTVENSRQLRSKGLIAESKAIKATLPVVTFSGKFSGAHRAENLSEYTNLMVIDVDGLDFADLSDIKNNIFTDPHILATWISPSNAGLKILFLTSSSIDTHKVYFSELCDYLLTNYNIDVDKSGSDVCRLCFTSYDPEILIKFDCKPFSVNIEELELKIIAPEKQSKTHSVAIKPESLDTRIEKILFYATEGKNNKNDRNTIDKILKYLRSKKLSITSNYQDWYKVGLAISNTFTYDLGLKYYLYLCQLDGPAHDEYKSISMLQYCYRNRKIKKVNFATIIFLAEQKGFLSNFAK